jgi:integrase
MNLFKRCRCPASKCRHPFWFRFRMHGQEHRGTTRTANRNLADRIAHRRFNDALEGNPTRRRSTIKLSALVKTYVEHARKEHRTANKDERVLNQFQEFTGDRRAADISAFHIEKWKLARAQEVEQSTVNRELNVVRGMFRRAVDWKLLSASPVTKVRKYQIDDTRIRVLSESEIQIVLTKCPPDVVLLCRATLECLPRLSELLTLRREHIGAGWIEIRRKGGRVERVNISPELRAALLARVHRKGFVFGIGAAGEPPTQEATSVQITRIMRKVGLPNVSHHTMRHTGITMMLEAGVNPRVIQKLAGWTSLRMLERYGHVRDAEAQRAVTTMQSVIQRAVERPAEQSAEKPTAESTENRAQTRAQS